MPCRIRSSLFIIGLEVTLSGSLQPRRWLFFSGNHSSWCIVAVLHCIRFLWTYPFCEESDHSHGLWFSDLWDTLFCGNSVLPGLFIFGQYSFPCAADLTKLSVCGGWFLVLQAGMQARPRLQTGSSSSWCGFDPQWSYISECEGGRCAEQYVSN